MKRARKPHTNTVTYDEICVMKARDRKRDWDRIARGEATPQEIQKENSIFPDAAQYVVLNISEVAKAIRRRLRHRRLQA